MEATIAVPKVERGYPVVGLIRVDPATSAGRCTGLVVIHVKAEAVPAHNGMHMAGNLAGVDDGISSLMNDRAGARQLPESCGGKDEGDKKGTSNGRGAIEVHLAGCLVSRLTSRYAKGFRAESMGNCRSKKSVKGF